MMSQAASTGTYWLNAMKCVLKKRKSIESQPQISNDPRGITRNPCSGKTPQALCLGWPKRVGRTGDLGQLSCAVVFSLTMLFTPKLSVFTDTDRLLHSTDFCVHCLILLGRKPSLSFLAGTGTLAINALAGDLGNLHLFLPCTSYPILGKGVQTSPCF